MRRSLNDKERKLLETVLALIMCKEAAGAGLLNFFKIGDGFGCHIDCDPNISECGYITPTICASELRYGTDIDLENLGFYGLDNAEWILDNKAFKNLELTVMDFYLLYREWNKKLLGAMRMAEEITANKTETLPITSDIACSSKEESSSHGLLPYGKKKEELLKKLISSMQEVLDL